MTETARILIVIDHLGSGGAQEFIWQLCRYTPREQAQISVCALRSGGIYVPRLEARAPFLDVAWVEWTARLPGRYKVRGQQTKWLLKAAFADMLPPAVAARGKQGFGVPVGHWLRHELRDWARERLLANRALDEWFRPAAVARLFAEHMDGNVNHGKWIKWLYNQVPGLVQRLMAIVFAGIIYIAKLLVTRRNPLDKERGMDFWYDVIDWIGGYP